MYIVYIPLLHLQIISKYYQKMNATLGQDQRFEFEGNQVGLDIPLAGITTRDEAWRITALSPPVVCLVYVSLHTYYVPHTHAQGVK